MAKLDSDLTGKFHGAPGGFYPNNPISLSESELIMESRGQKSVKTMGKKKKSMLICFQFSGLYSLFYFKFSSPPTSDVLLTYCLHLKSVFNFAKKNKSEESGYGQIQSLSGHV